MQAKKIIPKLLIVAFAVGFGILCAVTGSITSPIGTLWSLFPPVVAICLALLTKEVYSSLFIGILVGGLLATKFNPIHTIDTVVNDGFISAVSGSAGIFIFLVILGIIVALLNKAGGSQAFGRWASKHVKTKFGASIATFCFGVLIFIDDYFNCLTVGAVMRPVTDKAKISRSKLAYLIDATAAPVCMIAPISSWAAAVSSYAPDGQGISLFCKAIPYNFYSLLTFVFIIAISAMKLDYGPMKLHEMNAQLNGDLYTSGEKAENIDSDAGNPKGKVIDLIIPVVTLIISCVIGLIYSGGFFDAESGAFHNVVEAFSSADASVGLLYGSFITLILSVAYFMIRRVISFKNCMDSIPDGFKAMVPAIMILACAWTLKAMTDSLGAKIFISQLIEGSAAGFQALLPAIIFVIAVGLSFATGTSWGTFGILIPIVIEIFKIGDPLQMVAMSACLAGAVCGDHVSPISDTTIMASAGGKCDHIDHVSTQIPYAIVVAAISFVSYIIAGFVQNAVICLLLGAGLIVGTLCLVKFCLNKSK